MNDAETVLAHYFGRWDTPAPDLGASPIGERAVAFLEGRDDCGMQDRVAVAVRTQFAVLHAYRVTLEMALKRAIAVLAEESQRGVEGLHLPMEPAEAYEMGGMLERHRAMGEARQLLQDAINAAWGAAQGVRADG